MVLALVEVLIVVLRCVLRCALCEKELSKTGWERDPEQYYCHEHRMVLPMRTIGLYIGRFQPFHNGHLAVIKDILKEVDQLKIVVGSAQHKGTKENPFDAEERKAMIYTALEEAKLADKVQVFPVPDILWHEKYADHIKEQVGDFQIVFTAENKMLNDLFTAKGCQTKTCQRIGDYVGTEIRMRIAEGKPWEFMVPPAVAVYLKKINAKRRLEIVFRS
ncbi:TPA: nicotinamide-nucleotide adenylyltransferase [Candidatus Woesearchaeota archaeon]|nr:nicotinamide-nucleotide adenylyltransferase [Candidatus Woesearchaeota archaeon]